MQAGVIVVRAGNNGPGLNTISSPATAPSVIAVGATTNDRRFAASVEVPGLSPFVAITSSGPAPATPIVAPLADVAAFDETGLLCSAIASGGLDGRIALIRRGTCNFEVKLNVARNAGAVAAVVFAAQDAPEPFPMYVGTATLPAQMVSYDDGKAIKRALAEQKELWGTVSFTLGPVPMTANRLTDFTAAGPNVDLGIARPHGDRRRHLHATQSLDSFGGMYSATGFVSVQGRARQSWPGAAALLKSARPG